VFDLTGLTGDEVLLTEQGAKATDASSVVFAFLGFDLEKIEIFSPSVYPIDTMACLRAN